MPPRSAEEEPSPERPRTDARLHELGFDLPLHGEHGLLLQWLRSGRDPAAWRDLLLSAVPAAKQTAAAIVDVLAQPRAVLLGHPGTGKSTALRYIAYAIAAGLGGLVGDDTLARLPILVRLVDYSKALAADSTLSLRDYVRDRHDRDRAPLFRHALEQGECLVMLDGLDEVLTAHQRAEMADQVEAFVADCPGNRFLLASRIVGYQAGRLTGDFTHFTLGPLPDDSIRDFVRKLVRGDRAGRGRPGRADARARAGKLFHAIEERPAIRRLADNPLLLTIIALVNWRGGELPNRRVEVYRHAAETLVESWPRVRRGIEFSGDEVFSLLQPVAYQFSAARSNQDISKADLLPLLAQRPPTPNPA